MGVNAQNVINIPDTNFKTYLVNNHTINTNQDTEIQESEAIAFAGSMFCDNKSISDLTGIESFTSLTKLYSASNQLTSLDISVYTALTYLNYSNNQISTIDLSNNIQF